MSDRDADAVFAGSVPELYDAYMVPLIFAPYADDLVSRLRPRRPSRVLEIAAGTGVATRAMAAALPGSCAIVATDLNPAMLDRARAVGTARAVEWRQADAMKLPFEDATFDGVVCQFGAMFFPDKPGAFAESRRVLGAGGVFIFSVWDRIEENEFADVVTTALASVFPSDPPRFMARTPHGYHERERIAADLAEAGFTRTPRMETVAARSHAESARTVAMAYCQGTPMRTEIEARDAARLGDATDAAAEAIAKRFGHGRVNGRIQALLVTVQADD
jgi:ubiquinone/menaquinone biosynthesis C-methylase UbiE